MAPNSWLVSAILVSGACAPAASTPPTPRAADAPPTSTKTSVPSSPYVLVLGTAQDAGLPQIGCRQERCLTAGRDASRRRLVSSLMLCDPRTSNRWLFDASPDLREQIANAADHPPGRGVAATAGPRPPLFEGIFLSHAHIGHYTGLMFLGRESYGAKRVPTWATARMGGFLRDNDPWGQLVRLQQIELRELKPDVSVALEPDIGVVALTVPHRDELSDTVAFVLSGPTRKLLYLPDIDKWDRWERRIEEAIAAVDVALLDGTFFADGEIPGRAMSEIPHPFIVESIARFAALPESERDKIWFTHLNHSNPAADQGGKAAEQVRAAGMHMATDMQIFAL